MDYPVSEYLINFLSYLAECLLTLACEQDIWSRDFWKSKRACEALELLHCWGGVKLVLSTALSVSICYWYFMCFLMWSFFPNLFFLCVCTCVTLLQAASCIATELAYVYELVSLYYILKILFGLLCFPAIIKYNWYRCLCEFLLFWKLSNVWLVLFYFCWSYSYIWHYLL